MQEWVNVVLLACNLIVLTSATLANDYASSLGASAVVPLPLYIGSFPFAWHGKLFFARYFRQSEKMNFTEFVKGEGCPTGSWPAVYPEGVDVETFVAKFESASSCWLNGIWDKDGQISNGTLEKERALWRWRWRGEKQPVPESVWEEVGIPWVDESQGIPDFGIRIYHFVDGGKYLYFDRMDSHDSACCMEVEGVPSSRIGERNISIGTFPFSWKGKIYNASYTRQNHLVNFTNFAKGNGCPAGSWPAVYPEGVTAETFLEKFESNTSCWLNGISDKDASTVNETLADEHWIWQWNGEKQPVPARVWDEDGVPVIHEDEGIPADFGIGIFHDVDGEKYVWYATKDVEFRACCMVVEGVPASRDQGDD